MEEDAKFLAELLKVLANENRLLIVCFLMKQPMSVGKIGEKIPNITQSALSQHLSLLKAHGIVDNEKHGQSVIYSIADIRIKEVILVLKKHFCDI